MQGGGWSKLAKLGQAGFYFVLVRAMLPVVGVVLLFILQALELIVALLQQ
jgi:hypothetical protein